MCILLFVDSSVHIHFVKFSNKISGMIHPLLVERANEFFEIICSLKNLSSFIQNEQLSELS
jgi:hypothetical protein